MTRPSLPGLAVAYARTRSDRDARALLAATTGFQTLRVRRFGRKAIAERPHLREELMQEAALAVLHAAEKFEPARHTSFLTYACWWIDAHVRRYIEGETFRFRAAPSDDAHLVTEMAGRRWLRPDCVRSLNEPAGEDRTLADVIASPEPGPEDMAAESESAAHAHALVRALPEAERFVLRRRFLDPDEPGLRGVGVERGVSRERIRQIEASGIKRLRKRAGVAAV